MSNRTNVHLEELRQALREMKPRQKIFEIVKAEMKRRGHWKQLPRGRHVKKPEA